MHAMMSKILLSIKVFLRKILYWLQYRCLSCKRHSLCVLDSEETIHFILEHHCSVCRYGDGEMDMITCLKEGYDESRKSDFQNYHPTLALRLKEILEKGSCKNLNLLVCIPYVWKDHHSLTFIAQRFIERSFVNNREMIFSSINPNSLYGDSYFSRFYIDARDKDKYRYVQYCRQIWDKREICIVEGEQSRLGVGNDLFSNANSIQRILCPALNAFEKYDEIFQTVCQLKSDKLVLLALGHTATVLAYDLAKEGYQAIDIGHIDIEYEWMLMKATKKVPIPHKYVNEVVEGRNFTTENDQQYLSQIRARI